ncbi:MAG: hypothetical protein LC658_07075 [Bacteroidales bacterium]|nr:hypothetical protein [Bacteroidales bacterium]
MNLWNKSKIAADELVLGRTILQESLNGNGIHKLDVNVRSQIVIVYAKTDKAMLSRKVFVH